MKVKRLKMNSFRGIGDLTLEFTADEPTVLIGVNGVGKSSILECLAILLSLLTGWVQDYTGAVRSFSEQDITNGYNETHNEITISYNSQEVTWSRKHIFKGRSRQISSQDKFLVALGEILPQLKDRASSFQLQKSIRSRLEAIASLWGFQKADVEQLRLEWEAMTGTEEFQEVVDEIRHYLEESPEASLPLVVYYPVNRAVTDIPLEITEKHQFEQIDSYEQALTARKIDFKSFFEWFRKREDLENELRLDDNPDYRDGQLEAVREAIASLLPGFSDLGVRRSSLRMTVTKQGQELIIDQLSDGEKCLLAMVGDLARRLAIANPSLPDPLQGSGVVLIDEIELHLHPKWQREIIPALTRTFPNCQFIVTTHSPQVISDVQPDSIYILEATPEGIVAKRPDSSFGRDSNYILEVLMGTPARKEEIKDELLELFRLIDRGDLDGARQLRQQIANQIGSDEPELVKANVLLRRKEILNR